MTPNRPFKPCAARPRTLAAKVVWLRQASALRQMPLNSVLGGLELFSEMNSCKYLYLDGFYEPEENELQLQIVEADSGFRKQDIMIGHKNIEGVSPIETMPGMKRFDITFEVYIGFAITNESYAANAEDEEYRGNLARIYTKSRYLEFISNSTIASDIHPGPYRHYAFCCQNHAIDIVSCHSPLLSTSKI